MAIVATALRLPGADSLDEYWARLLTGTDSISRGDDTPAPTGADELPPPSNARYVSAYGALRAPTAFDAERFGMSPAEAMLTDPQQRLLLEVVDEAIHNAALSASDRHATAVFVATGPNRYAAALRAHRAGFPGVDEAAVELGTARDYVAGKLAHRLDLRGPAMNVLAACSTGLVCTHLAIQALLRAECDVAVAGVATLRFPLQRGYWAALGMNGASDGVCRPFDARASGSVPADGAAVLILRRLADAVALGDDILAVIRGSAVTNDGAKQGFKSVQVDTQTRVIAEALRAAEVEPREVRCVETHGTATRLGDAVEWAALQELFGANHTRTLVGAVKGNLGHTREAAGLAGLLKAALCLRHGVVPATANFEALPRDLEYPGSALTPVATSTPFTNDGVVGVSAFGLGGTNCHVVLGAAPARAPTSSDGAGIIYLSSHRTDTLEEDTAQVCARLDELPDARAELAWRSRRSEHRLRVRRYLRPGDRTGGAVERQTRRVARRAPPVVFAFPGVGSEYRGMGAGLAARFEVYRRSRDEIVELAAAAGVKLAVRMEDRPACVGPAGPDLRRMIRRSAVEGVESGSPGVAVRHLSLFACQIALVDLLAASGIRPAAVMGHSMGEWTAATVAGVMTRQDAVRWIAERARLIEEAPPGTTLAVAAAAESVEPQLVDGVTLVSDNSPQSCAISGPADALGEAEARLRAAGLVCRRVASNFAFHNPSLAPAARALRQTLAGSTFGAPMIPMVSAHTGEWLKPGELDEAYWESQMVTCVRFRKALERVAEKYSLVLELGPGNVGPWVTQLGGGLEAIRTFSISYEGGDDADVYGHALAELWLRGLEPRASGPVIGPTPAPNWLPSLRRIELDPSREAEEAPANAAARPMRDERPKRATDVVRAVARCPAPAVDGKPDDLLDRLSGLWCGLLGVGAVEPDAHFFDLGGDSLLGHHLIAKIEEAYGVAVPGPVVFRAPTLAGMAASIRAWMAEEVRDG